MILDIVYLTQNNVQKGFVLWRILVPVDLLIYLCVRGMITHHLSRNQETGRRWANHPEKLKDHIFPPFPKCSWKEIWDFMGIFSTLLHWQAGAEGFQEGADVPVAINQQCSDSFFSLKPGQNFCAGSYPWKRTEAWIENPKIWEMQNEVTETVSERHGQMYEKP